MMVYILCFLSLALYGSCYTKKTYNEQSLGYDQTVALRGICAVEIMLGHVGGGALTDELLLFPFKKAGILIVGVFFFLSGYGLLYSLKTKPDYLRGFLKKRLGALLLPVGVYCLLFLTVFALVYYEQGMSVTEVGISLITSINWYIWEIMGLYFLFYIAYKYMDRNKATLFILLISIVIIVSCYLARVGNPWYGSTLCFPLGLYAGEYKDSFLKWFRNRAVIKGLILAAILGAGIIAFFILPERSVMGAIISRNVASLSFVLLLFIVLQKVVIGNRVSDFLGRISYEIFLIHPLVIGVLHSDLVYINNAILYTGSVILLTFAGAILLNSIVGKLGNSSD